MGGGAGGGAVGGCNVAYRTLFDLMTPLFSIGAGPFISLISSMSMTVILAPCKGTSDGLRVKISNISPLYFYVLI